MFHHLLPITCQSCVKGGVPLFGLGIFFHLRPFLFICALSFVYPLLRQGWCVAFWSGHPCSFHLPPVMFICLPSFVSPLLCRGVVFGCLDLVSSSLFSNSVLSLESHHLLPILCFLNPVSGVVFGLGVLSFVSNHLSPIIGHPSFTFPIVCQGWCLVSLDF